MKEIDWDAGCSCWANESAGSLEMEDDAHRSERLSTFEEEEEFNRKLNRDPIIQIHVGRLKGCDSSEWDD